jgi:NAD(P)-dependent dehydrogenase (short-subunit alcohol dehydrogenase family)
MLAIVTGGTRGIGLAVSKKLIKDGYTVIAASRGESDEFAALKASNPDKAYFFPCDISKSEDRLELIDYALNKFGAIDLLINNAGIAPKIRKDMLDITEEDYDFVLDINLKGTFFITQAVARAMLEKKTGRIINISSISSFAASVNRAEYCLSKAGISMATKLFSARLNSESIGVFEIMPGIIKTDMTAGVREKYEKLISDGIVPVSRMGEPEDIADCVSAIAEGKLDYCSGTIINADGGFSIRRL